MVNELTLAFLKNLNENNIQLGIKMQKLIKRYPQTRYFRIYIGDRDVTVFIADLTHSKISKAKDTYGCMIVHGGGMDMGFSVQYDAHCSAKNLGYDVFDRNNYIYIE